MRVAKAMKSPGWQQVTQVLFSLPLLLLLTGCPYESQNPLGIPTGAKIDERLLGKWKYENKENGEAGLVTISRFNDTELLVVLEEEGKKERQMLRGFVTNIAGRNFLNLQEIQGGYETRQWIFVSYATGDCSLTYGVVNDSLVPAGKAPGLSSGQLYELIKNNLWNTHIYDKEATLACVRK